MGSLSRRTWVGLRHFAVRSSSTECVLWMKPYSPRKKDETSQPQKESLHFEEDHPSEKKRAKWTSKAQNQCVQRNSVHQWRALAHCFGATPGRALQTHQFLLGRCGCSIRQAAPDLLLAADYQDLYPYALISLMSLQYPYAHKPPGP